ncbi:hypothetical protein [Kitasatospora sp. NPDC002040]|uniref:hypothetical protein n=1 Tax=Kitasatospora sp. NPDC002040 TaxID=3154661 RepID=UPI003322D826
MVQPTDDGAPARPDRVPAPGPHPHRPTGWTRTLGLLSGLALLCYLLAAVALPWRPGVRPLLIGPLAATALLGAGWLLARVRATRRSPPAPPIGPPPPPRPEDVRALLARLRRRDRLTVLRVTFGVMAGVLVLLCLFAPFSGPAPELAQRRIELAAAGAAWGDYEILPPLWSVGTPTGYPPGAPYRIGPVGDTPGEPVELPRTAAVAALPVGARLRVLHLPGSNLRPVAAVELTGEGARAPIARKASWFWGGAILFCAFFPCLNTALSRWTPSRRTADALLAGPWHWHRVDVTGRTVSVPTLPERRTDPEQKTEQYHLLRFTDTGEDALLTGPDTPSPGPGWLSGTDPRQLLLVTDSSHLHLGSLYGPLPAATTASPPEAARHLTPVPEHLTPGELGWTLLAALWPATWSAYHLLDPTCPTLPFATAAVQLLLGAVAYGLLLATIATTLARRRRRSTPRPHDPGTAQE